MNSAWSIGTGAISGGASVAHASLFYGETLDAIANDSSHLEWTEPYLVGRAAKEGEFEARFFGTTKVQWALRSSVRI
jgi:hypothetical protein